VTVSQLRERGYSTFRAEDSVISSYQTALSRALTPNVDSLFYCDLDRALHWIKSHPQELEALATTNYENDFVLIGRTRRAFDTHPETQTITEGIGNTLASKVLGFQETRDILGTTWILTPTLAKKVIKLKQMNQFGFYAEWPITLWRSARRPKYVESEGLEWETPDRYPEEIRAQGLDEWRRSFQTASEWRKRTEMLRDFIGSSFSRKGSLRYYIASVRYISEEYKPSSKTTRNFIWLIKCYANKGAEGRGHTTMRRFASPGVAQQASTKKTV
jgi:hypothetical protein